MCSGGSCAVSYMKRKIHKCWTLFKISLISPLQKKCWNCLRKVSWIGSKLPLLTLSHCLGVIFDSWVLVGCVPMVAMWNTPTQGLLPLLQQGHEMRRHGNELIQMTFATFTALPGWGRQSEGNYCLPFTMVLMCSIWFNTAGRQNGNGK